MLGALGAFLTTSLALGATFAFEATFASEATLVLDAAKGVPSEARVDLVGLTGSSSCQSVVRSRNTNL